jgi:drug/metabolite transporter (DMT)-like permease
MLLATIGRTLDELGIVNHKMLSRAGSRLALLALMAGATGIAFAPIFVRVSEVGPVTTAFYRLLFALPVLWLWSSIERNSNQTALSPQSAGDYRDLALAGLLFAADLAVWHWSIHLTSVANATLLANASPIFVTVGARLLFSERIYPAFVLGMLLAFSGVVVLMGASLDLAPQHLLGDALALLAAVFYAGYQLTLKHLRGAFSTATVMSWSGLTTCLALWPMAWLSSESLLAETVRGWVILVGLAWVAQVLGQSLIAYAFAHLPASFSSVGLLLQPVIAALLAWGLLNEPLQPMQALGGIVVLFGIVMARRSGE